MMAAEEYEALKNSIPETRPESERGAAAIAAHLEGKARAHELPDGMDAFRATSDVRGIRGELMRVEYRQQMALAGRDPLPRDEFIALSERRNALSAALAAARMAAAV